MIDGKRVLAVIPARGGSKRLPRKNLKWLLGKPLLVWTIQEALKSAYIDTLIVSTEDDEIEQLALSYVTHCLKRPKILAQDNSTINECLLHALNLYPGFDLAVVLQQTSPLRIAKDIDCGIELGFSISVGPDGKPNGAVYCVEVPFFLRYPYFGGQVFYMPAARSVDINTIEDFLQAENYLTLSK